MKEKQKKYPYEQKRYKKINLNGEILKIDYTIADGIIWLNEHGYETYTCCSGDLRDHKINVIQEFHRFGFIAFKNLTPQTITYIKTNCGFLRSTAQDKDRFGITFDDIEQFNEFMRQMKQAKWNE